MPHCVYTIATNEWRTCGIGEQPFDPLTEGSVFLTEWPDPRLTRHNGAGGIRPATAQEIADYDAARLDDQAKTRVDDKLIKAVIIYLIQRLNELRTQPTTAFPALTAQNVRDGIIAIYKTL